MTKSREESLKQRFRRKDLYDWINLSASFWVRLKSKFYYPLLFGSFGRSSLLFRPTLVGHPKYIHIGRNVHIQPGARLEVVITGRQTPPELRIGNNVNIEQNVHIVCHNRISIEDDVSITGFCSIVDTTHPIDDIGIAEKIGKLILEDDAFVEIGKGAFLGMGARILPNVRIGRGAVIGANAVVTRDIPDFAIAAGIPAVVRRHRRLQPGEMPEVN